MKALFRWQVPAVLVLASIASPYSRAEDVPEDSKLVEINGPLKDEEITKLPYPGVRLVFTSDVTFEPGQTEARVGVGVLGEQCYLVLNSELVSNSRYIFKKGTTLQPIYVEFSLYTEGTVRVPLKDHPIPGMTTLIDWAKYTRGRYDIQFSKVPALKSMACFGRRVTNQFSQGGSPLEARYAPVSIGRLDEVLDDLSVRVIEKTVVVDPSPTN